MVVNKKDPTLKQNGGWGERKFSLCIKEHKLSPSKGAQSGEKERQRKEREDETKVQRVGKKNLPDMKQIKGCGREKGKPGGPVITAYIR